MKWLGALVLACALAGCGYHVAGHADLLPKNIKTIAIPAFTNVTTRYRLSERLPAAITREFLSRTRYRVTADSNEADATLRGSVVNFFAYPILFDPTTNRASSVQLSIILQIQLTDRSGKVLFSRPGIDVRERYEISTDPKTYLEENDAALERASRDVARTIVSAILENF